MNLLYLLGINFTIIVTVGAYFNDKHHKLTGKKKFPFKNYYLVSTQITNIKQKSKRSPDFNQCLDLIFSYNNYKICISSSKIESNGIGDKNTKLIIYNQQSEKNYTLNQLGITFAKGYIDDKPYSSAFSGYIDNNSFYGKLEVDSNMFYIDPVNNFPSLIENGTTENAVIYEIPAGYIPHLYKSGWFYQTSNEKSIPLRRKRSASISNRGLCSLLVIIDNSFLRIISQNNIKSAIIKVLHSIDLANALFRMTDFDNDGIPDNIGFKTKYVILLESETIGMNKLPKYSENAIDGRKYLQRLSQYELLGEVCLGVAFTAQPFLNRVLGLSYTGVSNNFVNRVPIKSIGGICERPSRIEGIGTYNNLVITYRLEHGEIVPQITSDLSLVHELGHSFGSDHDNDPKCKGYLMAPHTSNSTYGHNFIFSNCSKKQIAAVVENKGSCLEISSDPFCGNGIVEGDEDCDCGLSFTCIQNDQCCVARNTKGPACTVNKDAEFQCHPSQGLCCMHSCLYRDISHLNLTCKNFQRKCPCKGTNTRCKCGVLGTCVEDECHSIECTRIGMKECNCTQKIPKCSTCCYGPDGTCSPVKILTKRFATENKVNWNQLLPYNIEPKSRHSFNGTTSYENYCVKSKCVTLPFRSFKNRSFCLSHGRLGICGGYSCGTNISLWSELPEKSQFRKVSGANVIYYKMYLIIYTLYLVL